MRLGELEAISREELRLAFVEAFSDYELRIEMGAEKFEEFLRARSIDLGRSLGAFDQAGGLAGFLLLGRRASGGKLRFYDGATGLLPAFRSKGLGGELLGQALKRLEAEGGGEFFLEVLEHNEPAIRLYEKRGFRKTRRLRCFRAGKEAFLDPRHPDSPYEAREEELGAPAPASFELHEPSWQNTLESIALAGDSHARVGLHREGRLRAYGFIHRKSGTLPGLCLAEEDRGAECLDALIRALAPLTQASELSAINVEEASALCALLEALGFENYVNQYEMVYEPPARC